jgi:hypothetical protein
VRGPRLRKKGQGEEGEVPIPAYETMRQDGKLGSRMLEILLRGVSSGVAGDGVSLAIFFGPFRRFIPAHLGMLLFK